MSKDLKNIQELPLFSIPPEEASEKAPTAVPSKPKALSVTELTLKIRGLIEPELNNVWVQAEISNVRKAPSGHLYFSLKDESAQISAAIFGWGARKRTFELEDGLSVLCRGKVTVYPPRGSYQITVDQIEPVGAGALQLAFEQLKKKLASEGLFDAARKRSLPPFPKKIAVITSPTGAAIQDMLTILKRRSPFIQVIIIPALVQGDQAAPQIVDGIKRANFYDLADVLVVARGGGSMEDLWCFNDEAVARAIFSSKIPVISAVGHEIDFTIADFVADLRAPTPSAAAEILSGHWVDSTNRLMEFRQRIVTWMMQSLQQKKLLLSHIAARIISPKDRLREKAQRCDDLALRLEKSFLFQLQKKKNAYSQLMTALDALSPLRVLERGYSLVRNPKENYAVVKEASTLKSGMELEITFHDGKTTVRTL